MSRVAVLHGWRVSTSLSANDPMLAEWLEQIGVATSPEELAQAHIDFEQKRREEQRRRELAEREERERRARELRRLERESFERARKAENERWRREHDEHVRRYWSDPEYQAQYMRDVAERSQARREA